MCVIINNDPYLISATLIDLNPVELNNHPFIISLNKCSRSCNSIDSLSTKICLPTKTQDINVKVFNMIANKNYGRTMTTHA